MGELLQRAAIKLVLTAAGIAITLAWWSWTGSGSDYEHVRRLPDAVFDGGAGTVTVKFRVNQPAELSASFGRYTDDDGEDGIEYDREFTPGRYERSVDVGEDTYLYFELQIPEAEVGAEIEWAVLLDGEQVAQEKMELDEPLTPGYAFFVQFEADSVEDIRDWMGS